MPVLLGDLVHQQIEERRTDPIIVEDVLARIPSRGNVIQRSNEFQSRWTGHAEMLIRSSYTVMN
jgi:hypothetical protein